MSVLVLGLGSIGMRHARNFRALGQVVDGFDPDEGRRSRFATEIGGRAFAEEAEALATAPSLVVVASPNRFHLRQALSAARAGIPLLIEKPVGTNLADAEELARVIAAENLYAHVGSNWKFHLAFTTMKEWLEAGRIGPVLGVQVLAGQWLPDWHPWEDFRRGYSARADLDGGVIFDTHELDYICWLAGPAKRFIGYKRRTGALPIETEDMAAALIELEGGAFATLQADYIQRQGIRRYAITGSEGSIAWSTASGQVKLLTSKGAGDESVTTSGIDVNDMYLAQSRRVLDDLRDGAPPETSVPYVLSILRLQLAWHRNGAAFTAEG